MCNFGYHRDQICDPCTAKNMGMSAGSKEFNRSESSGIEEEGSIRHSQTNTLESLFAIVEGVYILMSASKQHQAFSRLF